jgi:hypothetical protein
MRTETDLENDGGLRPPAPASDLPENPSIPERGGARELLEAAKGAIGRSMSGDSPSFLERNRQKGGE